MGKTVQLVFSLFFFFLVISIISLRGMVMTQSTRSTTTVQVKVGVVLDMNN
ncbi:hypothetical protein CsSME_00015868 [Camellia sinensis var. sinensis]